MTTNSWDDWVPQDRVRKFTDENKELAAQLHTQMRNLQRQSKGVGKNPKGTRANGSEMGSGRGSEERNPSVAAQGSRQRRNRDYDLEPVSSAFSLDFCYIFSIQTLVIVCWEGSTDCPAQLLRFWSAFLFCISDRTSLLKTPKPSTLPIHLFG